MAKKRIYITSAVDSSVAYSFFCSIEAVTDIVAFPDLIWDAHWLYREEVPRMVAIATAHNAVWCWDWESNVKQSIAQCEEPCILYPLYKPILEMGFL